MGLLTMSELAGLGDDRVWSNAEGRHVSISQIQPGSHLLRDPHVASAYRDWAGKREQHSDAARRYGRPTPSRSEWDKTPAGIAWARRQQDVRAARSRSIVASKLRALAAQPGRRTTATRPSTPSTS